MSTSSINTPSSPRLPPHQLRNATGSPIPASTGSVLAEKPETPAPPTTIPNQPYPPVTARTLTKDGQLADDTDENEGFMALEFADGSVYQGYSFGAQRSVSGEMVFQTGTNCD
jgi:hypothetical protein